MLLAATFCGRWFWKRWCSPVPRDVVPGLRAGKGSAGWCRRTVLVPHGMSVVLNAPAVFRWTAQADPARHLRWRRRWKRMSAVPVPTMPAENPGRAR